MSKGALTHVPTLISDLFLPYCLYSALYAPQSKIFFDVVSSEALKLLFSLHHILNPHLMYQRVFITRSAFAIWYLINHPRTMTFDYFPHVGCFSWWIEHPCLLFSIVTMSGRWPASIPSQAYPRKTTASLSSTNSKSLFFAVRTPL